MLAQIGLDLGDELRLVRTVRIQPEQHRHAGMTGAGDGELDPVADGGVLDLTHAPDIALLHVLAQKHLAGGEVGDVGDAVLRDFEGLVVRAVFLGLLRHQTDVGNGAHGPGIEGAVPLTEIDHLLIDAGEGAFRHHGLDVLEAAVGAPHLAAVADHGGHRRVHDHVVRRVEIGDALGGIDHRQFRPMLVAGMQVALDLVLLALRQAGDLVVEIDHAVVDVDAEFVEQLAVLGEGVAVEDPDAVAEHDGVRHLHHGGLHMQREHHPGLEGILDLLLVELQQRLLAHEHGVDDLKVLQRHLRLEHDGLAAPGNQLHLHVARPVQRHRLLAMVEVAVVHVRDVRARGLAPFGHAVRVLACVVLHRQRRAAVGVAFAQHRIDGAADAFGIARPDRLRLVRPGALGIVRDPVALALQLLDGGGQLRHGGADVGQLDDVGLGPERQLAELGQGVRDALLGRQYFAAVAHDARHRVFDAAQRADLRHVVVGAVAAEDHGVARSRVAAAVTEHHILEHARLQHLGEVLVEHDT